MNRPSYQRRVYIDDPKFDAVNDHQDSGALDNQNDDEDYGGMRVRPSEGNVTEGQEPFMGIKVRRKASLHRECKGDYIDVSSNPYLTKILKKQGDNEVLFADKLLKFTSSGKIKRRILLITDCAIYIFDPVINALKRRIVLAAVEKICLSELSDNFFAIIIPTEYDLLMASTRKTEIVNVLVEATKRRDYEFEVSFCNSFEYNASAELVKEVHFEEVEGGVKTRFDWK